MFSAFPTVIFADSDDVQQKRNVVISEQLQAVMEKAKPEETIQATVWFQDADTTSVKRVALSTSGFFSREPDLNLSKNKTVDDVKAFVADSRELSKKIYRYHNENMVQNCLQIGRAHV